MKARTSQGFSVIEIVIASAIMLGIVAGAAGAWQLYLRLSGSSGRTIQAALLLDEGSEAVQILRDAGWSNISGLSLNTPYYLYWNGSQYATSTSAVLIQGQYIRTITLKAVSRDATTFNIVSSGGSNDPDSRDVAIAVSLASSSIPIATSETLIHNVFND